MLGRHFVIGLSLAATLVALGLPAAEISSAAASRAAAPARPVVTGVHANSGSTVGQAHVIVEGRGFTHVKAVYFGNVRSKTVRLVSARELVAFAPPQRHAVVHVVVKTASGSSTKSRSSSYRYVHASLPAAWTDVKTPAVAGADPTLDHNTGATACPSARCYFVGSQDTSRGNSVPTVGTVDGSSTTVTPLSAPADQPYTGYAYLAGLTCASATFCVADGQNGGAGDNAILATLSRGSWTVVTAPSPSGTTAPVFGETISDVSCGAPGSCVALGYLNYQDGSTASTVLTLHQGAWTATFGPYPDTKDGGYYVVDQLSCATASWCLMAGSTHLIVDRAGHFSAETIPEPPGAEWAKATRGVTTVSCPAVQKCTMLIDSHKSAKEGDGREDFLTDRGGTLAYHPITVPADSRSIAGVSEPEKASLTCPDVDTCFTYDTYEARGVGNQALIARLDRGSVREYALPQVAGRLRYAIGVSALACSSATACVAVGVRHRHVAYETFADGVWTPRVIAGFGQNNRSFVQATAVSCAPSGTCLASGGYTYTVQSGNRRHVHGAGFLALGADR
jgi:hypothetical protein